MMEKFWIKLAWLMPRKLVYWCSIRLGTNATQDEYSNQIVPELKFMDALSVGKLCALSSRK